MKNLITRVLQDKVLLIATLFAVISMFFIPPSFSYYGYINQKVLIVMFCLMISVAGMSDENFFMFVAVKMIKHLKNMRAIVYVIIITTFFLGMLVTNDAVLLTLVPFTLFITSAVNKDKSALMIVILQTLAANLGSALTPMGDPQNIFLYTNFHIPFFTFIEFMLPITITGFILILLTVGIFFKSEKVEPPIHAVSIKSRRIFLYFATFILTIVCVLGYIDIYLNLTIVGILSLLFARKQFRKVDYPLLLTFTMFFIFTGNVGQIPLVRQFFAQVLASQDSVFYAGIITSQFMSNVPATILLSAFTPTHYILHLLQGVNIGAMGSLIGSLASLITFKFVMRTFPHRVKEYFMTYTIICLVYMAIIIVVVYLV